VLRELPPGIEGHTAACEVDIYGALSEYMATCATDSPATLLDINNTVPADMFDANKKLTKSYKPTDLFMGFHCGNTPSCCLVHCGMKYQLIMNRLMEPARPRTSPAARSKARSVPGHHALQDPVHGRRPAQVLHRRGSGPGHQSRSFGGIGVFAIPEMGRFYRHVLIEKRFPHHTSVAFAHVGKPCSRPARCWVSRTSPHQGP